MARSFNAFSEDYGFADFMKNADIPVKRGQAREPLPNPEKTSFKRENLYPHQEITPFDPMMDANIRVVMTLKNFSPLADILSHTRGSRIRILVRVTVR